MPYVSLDELWSINKVSYFYSKFLIIFRLILNQAKVTIEKLHYWKTGGA